MTNDTEILALRAEIVRLECQVRRLESVIGLRGINAQREIRETLENLRVAAARRAR